MRIIIIVILSVISIGVFANDAIPDGAAQWDFDHKIQFKEKKLAMNKYYIEVIPKLDTNFGKLSKFLLRHSFKLCGNYGFKVEILSGIEAVDERESFPNKIMSSLSANIECPIK